MASNVSSEDSGRREEELEALKAICGDEDETSVVTSIVRDYKTDCDQDLWQIRVAPQVVLELQLPAKYPSEEAPLIRLKAPQYVLNEGQITDLTAELNEMWMADGEVAILWAEHCRGFLEELNESAGPPEDDAKEDPQEEEQFS